MLNGYGRGWYAGPKVLPGSILYFCTEKGKILCTLDGLKLCYYTKYNPKNNIMWTKGAEFEKCQVIGKRQKI